MAPEATPQCGEGRGEAKTVRLLPGAVLSAERERWLLWFPVGVGVGIAAFFALPTDPPPHVAWPAVAAAVAAVWFARARPVLLALAVAVFAAALGFAAADRRTWSEAAPVVTRAVGPLPLTGRVAAMEGGPRNARIVLEDVRIDRWPPERTPRKIRLRYAGGGERPAPGATVALRARLLPSSPPAAPGAYDFQRHAFFQGIGATGFVVGPVVAVAPPPQGLAGGPALEMERWREIIAARVSAVLSGGAGGIAGALMHGEQSFVPDDAMQAMRDSGLAHLLSISGLHIGLVAGIVMYVVRAGLALFPYVALRWPCKKIAAVCGLSAAVAYTMLVGPSAPTIRSTLMTGLALAAVMTDRNPFSMRLVAFAAVVVMLFAPESMAGPSFQMSFAAVAALIAVYERISGPIARFRASVGPVWNAGVYAGSLALTSVVATVATAPFSLYHFQSIAVYGVLANMIAVPLTGVWIMPLILIIYILMPFGLEGPVLVALGWGVDVVLLVAEQTAALPGAVASFPAMPVAGLAATVLGGCWLLIWKGKQRWWGAAVVALGLSSPAFADRPDVLINDDGRLTAVRLDDGRLALSTGRAERFTAETWLRRDGLSRGELAAGAPIWPERGRTPDGSLSCDAESCLYRRNGRTVALVRRPGALAEDCASSDAVATALQAGRRCKAPTVVDEAALRRGGAVAFYVRESGVEALSVNDLRGDRIWTR